MQYNNQQKRYRTFIASVVQEALSQRYLKTDLSAVVGNKVAIATSEAWYTKTMIKHTRYVVYFFDLATKRECKKYRVFHKVSDIIAYMETLAPNEQWDMNYHFYSGEIGERRLMIR